MVFCCCCSTQQVPKLPRHELHEPLGQHFLLAKAFAAWNGIVMEARRDREDVRRIQDRVQKDGAVQTARGRTSREQVPATPAERRSSLRAARAAELGAFSLRAVSSHDEVAYIKRIMALQGQEMMSDQHAEVRREARQNGTVVPRQTGDDHEEDDPMPLSKITPQPLPSSEAESTEVQAALSPQERKQEVPNMLMMSWFSKRWQSSRTPETPETSKILQDESVTKQMTDEESSTSASVAEPVKLSQATACTAFVGADSTTRTVVVLSAGVSWAESEVKATRRTPAKAGRAGILSSRDDSGGSHGNQLRARRMLAQTERSASSSLATNSANHWVTAASLAARSSATEDHEATPIGSPRGDSFFFEANGSRSSVASIDGPGRRREHRQRLSRSTPAATPTHSGSEPPTPPRVSFAEAPAAAALSTEVDPGVPSSEQQVQEVIDARLRSLWSTSYSSSKNAPEQLRPFDRDKLVALLRAEHVPQQA
jgi:hypothetical protein